MKFLGVFLFILVSIPAIAYGNSIILENGSVLENRVLKPNDNIVVKGDANVIIKNCIIDTQKKIAIEALPGKGRLVVENPQITSRTGKGIYVEEDREIFVAGSKLINNREEGIDIRAGARGEIKDNVLSGNGESGIELIVGNANLKIQNNIFQDNGSSGLSIQFYLAYNKEGKIDLVGNTFKGNQKYGVDCSMPEGRRPSDYYWYEAASFSDNVFRENKLGEASEKCNITFPLSDSEIASHNIATAEFEKSPTGFKNEDNLNRNGFWSKIKSFLTSLLKEIFQGQKLVN
jgi:parallel beta-helix repeat protein